VTVPRFGVGSGDLEDDGRSPGCRSAGAAPAHLRGRVGLGGGPDGALEVLVDLEELVEPRDGEDPAHALVRRGDGHRPAVPRETLEASDDDPQTGGVEEGD